MRSAQYLSIEYTTPIVKGLSVSLSSQLSQKEGILSFDQPRAKFPH